MQLFRNTQTAPEAQSGVLAQVAEQGWQVPPVQSSASPQSWSAVQLVGTQAPFALQNDPFGQRPRGSTVPTGTAWQLPIAPGNPQLWQGPVQAVSQQNPSTQKPLTHSLLLAQANPIDPPRQVLATQESPPAQSADMLQKLRQRPASTSHR